jgi:2-haloacid dehalogenase
VAAQVDAVVLDVGGVVLTWDPRFLFDELIPEAAVREHFLTTVCPPEWNLAQDAGRPWADGVAEAVARHPDAEVYIRAFDEQWHRTVGGPITGTIELMEDLQANGVDVYALTNFSAEKWPVAVQRWPMLGRFDGVVVSGAEGIVKPDPRIYRLLLDRFDLRADRTYFTDDNPANVAGARAVGLIADEFTTAERLRQRLVDLAVLSR